MKALMKNTLLTLPLLAAALLAIGLAAPWALAHEGHGLPGPHHWHASDVAGFVVAAVAAVAAAALWWRGRK
jgi:hypothetical protein